MELQYATATTSEADGLGKIQSAAYRGIVNGRYLDRNMTEKPSSRLMEHLVETSNGASGFRRCGFRENCRFCRLRPTP
ncbi:MAG: hypothetical protein HYS17_06960 [Micavibrio aeruginosavorus]|uniref:Uncharacterized protein n=1 Tax=Micavibrio aeruginosavorus TaxID=349221 RepID=A0A7T5R0K0_9BACT|nr:MAG: hypothetical protein HYS17_06960 [Micavibrio aeruginosavorus]